MKFSGATVLSEPTIGIGTSTVSVDGAAAAVGEGDLLRLRGDVLDGVEHLELAALADDVARLDGLAVELVGDGDVERQVTVEVADRAQVLLAVDRHLGDLLAVLDVEAVEAVEVAKSLGRDRVGQVDRAGAGQDELLVDALCVSTSPVGVV